MNQPESSDITPQLSLGFENPYDYVGVEHNKLLDYYYDNYDLQNYKVTDNGCLSIDFYNDILSIVRNFCLENGYNREELENSINELNRLFYESDMFIEINGQTFLDNIIGNEEEIIQASLRTGKLDQLQYEEVKHIIEAAINNESIVKIKEMVDTLPKESYNPEEMKGVLCFISTFEHSYNYWNNTANLAKTTWSCSSSVIIWDAWGTLTGSILGPWGSVIYGAIWSIAANEGCNLQLCQN